MIQINKHLTILLLFLIFISMKINAQEVKAIDNKGTIVKVKNTRIFTGTKPSDADAVSGDMYFDVYPNPTIIEVWDETTTSWKLTNAPHTGTTGSVFFAGTAGNPTENNSQLFWNNTNNRFGIGTNTPTNKFHVTGAARVEGILNSDGNVSEPSYRFNNDTDTGLFRPAADEISIGVGGIEAINIDETSGDTKVIVNQTLGINTNTPTERLDVDGKLRVRDIATVTTNNDILTTTTFGVVQKKKLIAAETDNQITTGANGGVYYNPTSAITSPIIAMGKINASGRALKITTGYTITKLGRNGRYRVNFPTTLPDHNYIIQLSALKDNKIINYDNQQRGSFDIEIRRRNNGKFINSEFMFTVINFSSASSIPTSPTAPTLPTSSDRLFPIYDFNDDRGCNGGRQEAKTGYAQTEPGGYPPADIFEITITDSPYDILTIVSANIAGRGIASTNISVASGPSATRTGYDHLITVNARINQYEQLQIFFNTNINGNCCSRSGSCPTVNFYTR